MVDQAVEQVRDERQASVGPWVQEVLALSKRWYFQITRERLNLVFSVAQPAIWLVFFGLAVQRAIDPEVTGTTNYLGFMLPGIIAFTMIGNGMGAAMPLLFDKETGYLDKLMSMPIARSSIIVSRFVSQLLLGWAQIAVVLGMAAVIGTGLAAGPAGVLAILVVAGILTMAVTAVALAVAYAVPGHGTFFAIIGFVTLPLLFMSNAFVPLDALPGWMALIARVNPLTYAITAIRAIVLDGWTRQVLDASGVLVLFAIGCLAVGARQFRVQTRQRVG